MTGRFPSDLGISPVKWLNERLTVPEIDLSSPSSLGIEPVNWFEERSSCARLFNSGQISPGISPENLLAARTSLWSCLQSPRSGERAPEREFRDKSRF